MTDAQIGSFDPLLFHVLDSSSNSSATVLHIEIVPEADLEIDSSVELTINVPISYPELPAIIRTSSPKLFAENGLLTDGNVIEVPWLISKTYPIAVWLYTIRNSFKRRDFCAWTTPVTLQRNFPSDRCVSGAITFMAGTGRMKGRRPYMEDVDFAFDEIRTSTKARVSLFGVLDGHGGNECSRFASEELPTSIIQNMRGGKSGAEALFKSYCDIDRAFVESTSSRAGSTATVMLWDHVDRVVAVANCGDSRSVLCREGRAIDITRDKKATDTEEIARICEQGGFVANGRVQGSLAVARTLGDRNLKQANSKYLIPDPEVTQFRLTRRDEFIIIATDGLWDVMSSQDAVTMAREIMESKDMIRMKSEELFTAGLGWTETGQDMLKKLTAVSEALGQEAYNLGSADNITVMIVLVLPTRSATEESCEPIRYPTCPPIAKSSGAFGSNARRGGDAGDSKSIGARPSNDIKSAPKTGDPLSPSSLTKEILNLLDDEVGTQVKKVDIAPRDTAPVSLRSEFASVAPRSIPADAKGKVSSKRTDDDEMMQFLLDDANF